MPLPILIQPVDVTFESIDSAITYWDEDAREPVQTVARKTAKTVKGQVKWLAGDARFVPGKGGAIEEADGYVTCRQVDLDAVSLAPQRGDKITKLGSLTTEVYVVRTIPRGHYADQGGNTLLKVYFEDRQPSR